jgi:hypothetical protein
VARADVASLAVFFRVTEMAKKKRRRGLPELPCASESLRDWVSRPSATSALMVPWLGGKILIAGNVRNTEKHGVKK